MKKLVGIAVFAAALAIGAVAQAAPIDIVATQASSNTWTLTVQSTLDIGAIAIIAPETATFAVNTANTAIAPIGSGSSYSPSPVTAGMFVLNLNPQTCTASGCTPMATSASGVTILGTFTAAGPGFTIGFDDGSIGGTAFDASAALNAYADSDITVRTVPEPVTAVTLGLGLAALGLVRRKAV